MQNELLEALKECAGILDQFLNSGRADAPSVDDVDRALTRANAAIRAEEPDPEATIPEQDVCGCHQPMRYCLFPKCGGRQQ